MTRVLFHLGYPKTGSTTLQYRLFSKHPQINYMSANVAPHSPFQSDPQTQQFADALSGGARGDADLALQLWHDHMVPHLDTDRINIVSEEDLMFGPIGGEAVLKRIADLTPQPELLIFLRPQIDVIRSRYDMFPVIDNQDHATGKEIGLPAYVDHILNDPVYANNLRYADRIAMAHTLFGMERVHVLTFQDVFKTKESVGRLAEILAIPPQDIHDALNTPATNDYSMHIMRRRIRRLLGPIHGSWFLSASTLIKINTWLGRTMRVKRTEMAPAEKAKITAFFADDTAKLSRFLPKSEV